MHSRSAIGSTRYVAVSRQGLLRVLQQGPPRCGGCILVKSSSGGELGESFHDEHNFSLI